jgi:hypothetical protein
MPTVHLTGYGVIDRELLQRDLETGYENMVYSIGQRGHLGDPRDEEPTAADPFAVTMFDFGEIEGVPRLTLRDFGDRGKVLELMEARWLATFGTGAFTEPLEEEKYAGLSVRDITYFKGAELLLTSAPSNLHLITRHGKFEGATGSFGGVGGEILDGYGGSPRVGFAGSGFIPFIDEMAASNAQTEVTYTLRRLGDRPMPVVVSNTFLLASEITYPKTA